MKTLRLEPFLHIFVTVVVLACICLGQSDSGAAAAEVSPARPLLLEKNEGELRTRRPRPAPIPGSQFMLKVGPKNNGSQHLVAGTEDIPPGASIPVHKHLDQDEILLIHSGVAHVALGEQERDLHAG